MTPDPISDGSTATTQTFGRQRQTQFSDGSSATTQTFGNQTVTDFSDGKSGLVKDLSKGRVDYQIKTLKSLYRIN